MNIAKRLELDNHFSRNGLGEVYQENPDYPDIWKTDERDYVTIRVPYSMRDRFNVFRERAVAVLGKDIDVLHVQEGSPFFGLLLDETWYFITCETAMALLDHFDKILPGILPEVHYR